MVEWNKSQAKRVLTSQKWLFTITMLLFRGCRLKIFHKNICSGFCPNKPDIKSTANQFGFQEVLRFFPKSRKVLQSMFRRLFKLQQDFEGKTVELVYWLVLSNKLWWNSRFVHNLLKRVFVGFIFLDWKVYFARWFFICCKWRLKRC